jgi:hypothetical protein
MESFVQQVVSIRVWKERLKRPLEDINDLCTVSDEAFAILVLENGWKNWVDCFLLADGEFKRKKRKRKQRDGTYQELDEETKKQNAALESKVPYKYTTHRSNSQANFHQWSSEGIKRFNELYDIVKARRAEQGDVDRDWLETKTDSEGPKTRERFIDIDVCRQDW